MSTISTDQDSQDLSLMAFDQYMRQVRWIQRLSPEEEGRLLQRVERGRIERQQASPNQWVLSLATHARNELAEHFQPLVVYVSARYARMRRSMDRLDLIQEGNIGLLTAIETYDAVHGCSFLTHASRQIQYAILDAIRQRDGMVRISSKLRMQATALERTEREYVEEMGHLPTPRELASRLQVREETVFDLLRLRTCEQTVSFEEIAASKTEDGDEDFLEVVSVFDTVFVQKDEHHEVKQMVQDALETVLAPRQRQVVQLHYGFHDGKCWSREEIAEEMGIVPHSVNDADRVARKKLRKALDSLYAEEQVA